MITQGRGERYACVRTDTPKLQNELPMSLSADSGQKDGRQKDSEASCLPLNVRKSSLETGLELQIFEGSLAFLPFSEKKHFH